MQANPPVKTSGGVAFEDGDDRGRIVISGRETGGRWSLMEYVVAPRSEATRCAPPDFGPHRHRDIEETFFVQSGQLHFLLGARILALGPGDLIRVPPGVRHGYANLSEREAVLLVSFHPGGFEELFVRHRSDQSPAPAPLGFIEDAVRLFRSEFEDHPEVR